MVLLLSTVFVASLIGSLHCIGMCGPFAVLSCQTRGNRSAWLPAIAYSCGRLVTYSTIGLIFGTLGFALNQSLLISGSEFSRLQIAATYIAGSLMIAIGVVSLGRLAGLSIPLPAVAAPLQSWLTRNYKRIVGLPGLAKPFAIGLLTCLMPCGWLYSFAIIAAGTAHPINGTLVMLVFWAGTVPILTGVVLGAQHVGSRLRARVPLAMSMMVILIGIFTIVYRAPVELRALQVSNSETELVRFAESASSVELPCCHSE